MVRLRKEFQEPKLEVPTIYKAYVRGYPHNSYGQQHMVRLRKEFQEPKLEVPTIYKAYIRPM